jgi:hypothetical protein
VQLHRDREQFDASGARLVVIGQGTPEQGAAFLASQKVDLPLYVDKGRESYKVAGTKIGTFGELLGPRMVAKGAAATAQLGIHQGRIVGHAAQLGGVLVIRPATGSSTPTCRRTCPIFPQTARCWPPRAPPQRLDAPERPLLHSVVATRGGAVR